MRPPIILLRRAKELDGTAVGLPPDRMPPGMDIRGHWRGLSGLATVTALAIAGLGGAAAAPGPGLLLGIPQGRARGGRPRRSWRSPRGPAGRDGFRTGRRAWRCLSCSSWSPRLPGRAPRSRGRRSSRWRPRGSSSRPRAPRRLPPARVPAGRSVGVVYAVVAFRVQEQVGPHGDEPHYLMVAESLLRDRDLRLEQDYAERRYAAFTDEDAGAALSRARPRRRDLLAPRDRAVAARPAGLRARRLRRRILLHGRSWRCCSCARSASCCGRPASEERPRWRSRLARSRCRLRSSSTSGSSSPRSRRRWCSRARSAACVAPAPWRARGRGRLGAAAVRAALVQRALRARDRDRPGGYALAAGRHGACRRRLARPPPRVRGRRSRCTTSRSTASSTRACVWGARPEFALATLAEGLPGLALDQEFGLLPYAPVFAFCVPGLVRLVRERTRLAAVGARARAGRRGNGGLLAHVARRLQPAGPLPGAARCPCSRWRWRARSGAASAPRARSLAGWGLWVGALRSVRIPRSSIATATGPRRSSAPGRAPRSGRACCPATCSRSRRPTAGRLTAVWTVGPRGRGRSRGGAARRPRAGSRSASAGARSSPPGRPRRCRAAARAAAMPCA